MANTIPCPNPTCSHDFSAAELQKASAVQCPKCGFRMQGQANPQPAPKPGKPAPVPKLVPPTKPKLAAPSTPPKPADLKPGAPPTQKSPPAPATAQTVKPAPAKIATPIAAPKPVAPVPKPISVPPVPPIATPITAPMATPLADDQFDVEPISSDEPLPDPVGIGTGELIRFGNDKKKFDWMRLGVRVGVFGFAASIVIIALYLVLSMTLGSGRLQDVISSDDIKFVGTVPNLQKSGNDKIYQLTLTKSDWAVESEVQNKFGAHVAWKNKTYDFWFALVVKDYGMFKPRDAEMLQLGIDKLETYFGTDLELGSKAEGTKFGDLAAQKIQFKGQLMASVWRGECYMFFKDGIAYWLYLASPELEVIQSFAGQLPEKNLSIISDRKGWREQPTPEETYLSDNGKVSIRVPKAVWEKHSAKEEDANGQLLLVGRYLKEKDNRKNALLLVFTIDKKENPKESLKAAREYLENRAKVANMNNKIAQAPEVTPGQSDVGVGGDVGNRRGQMIDLKLQFMDEPKRYYLLSVVHEGDKCYGILCDCTWESRQIWRQEFLELLRTLKF